MSEKLNIDDWLEDEQDALTEELARALEPLRTEPEDFAAGVHERIREAQEDPLESRQESIPGASGGRSLSDLDRLGWAAGFLPPMLISKGASKAALATGATAASKASLKLVPGLAALPFFTVLMIGATVVYGVRGLLLQPVKGAQRSDERDAAAQLRAWWRRNLVPGLLSLGVVVAVSMISLLDAALLLILAGSVAAVGQYSTLARAGLASRRQLGLQMGGFLLTITGICFQGPSLFFSRGTGMGPQWIAYALAPLIGLGATVCFGLATDDAAGLRGRLRRALLIWTGLLTLWVGFLALVAEVEVKPRDVNQWITEASDPQLANWGSWSEVGTSLRMLQDTGDLEVDLGGLEEVIQEACAKEGEGLNSIPVLALLRTDLALGSDLTAGVDPAVLGKDRWTSLLFEDRLQVGWPTALALLAFRSPDAVKSEAVEQVRRWREELAAGKRPYAYGGRDGYDRIWRAFVEAPELDVEGIGTAMLQSLTERILAGAPGAERYADLADLVLAAEMLEFIGSEERIHELAPIAHEAMERGWVERSFSREGCFRLFDLAEEVPEGVRRTSFWLTSVAIDTTSEAVEAMAFFGPPPATEGEASWVDLIALEAYLGRMAKNFRLEDTSAYSVLAASSLARLRSLPEFQQLKGEWLEGRSPLDVLIDYRLLLASVLLAGLAIAATLRAPLAASEPAS